MKEFLWWKRREVLLAIIFGLTLLAIVPFFLHADEQPPFENKDPAISENFRNIYYASDKLSLLSTLFSYSFDATTNQFCIDSPTFCVDALLHTVTITSTTFTGKVSFDNGATQRPSISFVGNSGMGFSRPTGNTLVLSFIGVGHSTWTTTNLTTDLEYTGNNITVSTLTVTSSATITNLAISTMTQMAGTPYIVTSTISVNGNKIVNLATGTSSGQAVNYDQLSAFGTPSLFTVAVDSVIAVTDTSFTQTGTKVTITASDSTHHVMLWASGRVRNNTAGGRISCSLFRDSTNLGDATNGMQAVDATLGTPMALIYRDTPGDTSSHIYQVYCKNNGTGTGHWGDAFMVVMMGWETR